MAAKRLKLTHTGISDEEEIWRLAQMDEEDGCSDLSSDDEYEEDMSYDDEDTSSDDDDLRRYSSPRKKTVQTSVSATPKKHHSVERVSRWNWNKDFKARTVNNFAGKQEVQNRRLEENCTPIDCFVQFFSETTFKYVLEMTNKHYTEKITCKTNFKLITMEELKAYFGLKILMSIVRLPRLDSYWQKKERLIDYPIPNEIMPRHRFRAINRYLHFCDEDLAPKPDDPEMDILYKIRPILNKIVPTFETTYSMGRDLAIDESLIPFKGRVQFRQFIPTKRARCGIKVWVLAESSTGYVSKLQLYTGKISRGNPELGLSRRVVESLLENHTGVWHHLYVDNFYTSPELFESLLDMGIYACGTVRHTRQGFPKDLVIHKVSDKPRGFSDWRASGPLLAQSWVDNRVVYFMSTIHSPEYDSQYEGPKKVKRRGGKEISCPPLLKNYNSYMGGVDLGDQMRKYYCMTRRCRSWCRRVFTYLLEVVILNSRVIYNKVNNTKSDSLKFRIELAKMLIGKTRRHTKVVLSDNSDTGTRFSNGPHYPQAGQHPRRCVVCSKKGVRSESGISCLACNVNLCVRSGKTCFKDWHTKIIYWL